MKACLDVAVPVATEAFPALLVYQTEAGLRARVQDEDGRPKLPQGVSCERLVRDVALDDRHAKSFGNLRQASRIPCDDRDDRFCCQQRLDDRQPETPAAACDEGSLTCQCFHTGTTILDSERMRSPVEKNSPQ